ncbi:hypothetical protein GOBAR_DD00768 [Gossypium barbadense]|nr:hypothetical protein GOBAR_DD00768 [Gossypium barbadense]
MEIALMSMFKKKPLPTRKFSSRRSKPKFLEITFTPSRAFTQPLAHLSRGRAGSTYRSFMVLSTSISATAVENWCKAAY